MALINANLSRTLHTPAERTHHINEKVFVRLPETGTIEVHQQPFVWIRIE